MAISTPFSGGVPVGSDHSVFSFIASPGLPEWLTAHRVSLVFTTYQAGRLIAVGRSPHGGVSVFQRSLERCMGLWVSPDGEEFWVATAWQLWRLANALTPGATHDGYDRVYIPRTGHTTGNLDIHDIALDANGAPVFVATKFNCLATLSPRHSLTPVWTPDFITDLAPEDRCHLNGLAMVKGQPGYVTAVSDSNTADGWRAHRHDGGIIIDVATGETITRGLSMPHSPRWHRKRLWLLNAGTGEFGFINPNTGRFAALTFLPGFARGLAFAGNYAIIGLSAARREFAFDGLPLAEELTKRGTEAVCGVAIVDLATGTITEWIRIEGAVRELYDVTALPDVTRPMVLGFVTDEIQHMLSIDTTPRPTP
jgi:uncharacterized protein (TIGR03032 family)